MILLCLRQWDGQKSNQRVILNIFKRWKVKYSHYLKLIDLNVYTDAEDIDVAFQVLDKMDFCIPKKGATNTDEFNPYNLDP